MLVAIAGYVIAGTVVTPLKILTQSILQDCVAVLKSLAPLCIVSRPDTVPDIEKFTLNDVVPLVWLA